jgi:hypothetical protein
MPNLTVPTVLRMRSSLGGRGKRSLFGVAVRNEIVLEFHQLHGCWRLYFDVASFVRGAGLGLEDLPCAL